MPAPSTVPDFLELVKKSGVIEERRLNQYVEQLRAQGTIAREPEGLATQLVQEGLLTKFQSEQFLQGKWRRFTIGKYKVLERLGAGGMGSVYLCEHTLMRRRVALKVLPASNSKDSSSLERFYREARAVAALDHPNIVRAYDIDHEDALHFLVMEHVDGASLQEMVKRAGTGMDPIRAAHYIRQAALGLQHAHEAAGLVHRDIKPGNILVDRNGIVKVLDMGLARFFHDEEDPLTKQYDENILGTADYLSPEQALDSHTVDIRSDIYSLGGTLYYCLTGRTPFTEGSVAQKLIWHQTRHPKRVSEFRSDVPEGILDILDRMMAKKPDDRFQTPQEVADALAVWTQTPIPPPPDVEMPQLSLAATRALNATGDNSMAGRGSDSGSRAKWLANTGSNSGTATHAPLSPVPQASSETRRQVPSTTPAMAPPPPPPRMSPPPPPSTPRPAAVTPPPPPPMASAVPAPPVPSVLPAPEANPTPAVEPEPESDFSFGSQQSAEASEFVPPASSPLSRTSTSRRARGAPATKKGIGLFWPLVGGGAVVVLAFVLVLVVVYSTDTQPERPKRPPIRITAASSGGLTMALRRALDGDRIILETDITEADVNVSKKNLTIEGAQGKTITWRSPPNMPDQAKLLTIAGAEGLTLKNITFDAENRGMALIQIYSKCDGLKFDHLELRGLREYGLLFANADGTKQMPLTFQNMRIQTSNPEQRAVGFVLASHATIARTGNLVFRDLSITGPGKKFVQKQLVVKDGPPRDAMDRDSIELPSGLTIETIP
jgi:serine/threonine protein kinase